MTDDQPATVQAPDAASTAVDRLYDAAVAAHLSHHPGRAGLLASGLLGPSAPRRMRGPGGLARWRLRRSR